MSTSLLPYVNFVWLCGVVGANKYNGFIGWLGRGWLGRGACTSTMPSFCGVAHTSTMASMHGNGRSFYG